MFYYFPLTVWTLLHNMINEIWWKENSQLIDDCKLFWLFNWKFQFFLVELVVRINRYVEWIANSHYFICLVVSSCKILNFRRAIDFTSFTKINWITTIYILGRSVWAERAVGESNISNNQNKRNFIHWSKAFFLNLSTWERSPALIIKIFYISNWTQRSNALFFVTVFSQIRQIFCQTLKLFSVSAKLFFITCIFSIHTQKPLKSITMTYQSTDSFLCWFFINLELLKLHQIFV